LGTPVPDLPGFSDLVFLFGANSTYTDAGSVEITGTGDQKWESPLSTNIDLLSGLSNGEYLVELFARASTTPEGEKFHSNSGSNYIATFSAVPEPSAFLFGGLICGVLGVNFARNRQRAKKAS